MGVNVPPKSKSASGNTTDYRKTGDGLQYDMSSAEKIIRDPKAKHTPYPTDWDSYVVGESCDCEKGSL